MIVLILFILILLLLTNYNEHYTDPVTNHVYTSDEIFTHLSYITNVLSQNGIKHWIMFGTLLGAIRNGDIIDYDYDFDLGAHIEDCNKIMQLNEFIKFDKYELYLPHDLVINNKSYWRISIKIKYDTVIMGDIYLFSNGQDNIMRRLHDSFYMTPNISFPYWFVQELTLVKIRNKLFNAPRYFEILLRHWYGTTWITPIKSKSVGGQGDDNSDYYGTSKYIKLKDLIDFVNQYKSIGLQPITISYVFPNEQKEWVISNEIPIWILN